MVATKLNRHGHGFIPSAEIDIYLKPTDERTVPAAEGSADAIDDAIVSLGVAKPGRINRLNGGPICPSNFMDAQILEDIADDNEVVLIPSDATPKDLDYNYDVRMISPHAKTELARWRVQRFKSITKGQAKSLKVKRHAGWFYDGFISHSGALCGSKWLYEWDAQSRRFLLPADKLQVGHSNRWHNFYSSSPNSVHDVRMMLGLGFTEQICWSVRLIDESTGARLKVMTDPSGIRGFFADRDPGPSGRRQALRNWVSAHWRRRKTQDERDEAKAWVRRHLRGQMMFEWAGLKCEILPSKSDLIEAAKQV
jgi:hypothetical protein